MSAVSGRCAQGSRGEGPPALQGDSPRCQLPSEPGQFCSCKMAGEGFRRRRGPPATQPSWGHCVHAFSPAPALARAQRVSARLAQAPVLGDRLQAGSFVFCENHIHN